MKINYLILGLLFSCLSHADISMINAENSSYDYQSYVRISLNNQANMEITTDSNLIPEEARFIPAYGSVVFTAPTPNDIGIQHFRYINGNSGCDFYLDTNRSMKSTDPFDTITFITGVPINSTSRCYVETIYGVNHLAVNFSENNTNK
ncbi:TPA: hypothetical protein ACT96X_002503 [Legionella pneumophila]|uniref:hypothetical protein n=1 Tax=Legionella pneumophila TaxID=446 RepID=UPI000788BD7C|nr:hypothetical protein [Legionella pneumophila]MDW9167030.1 hypothetical protein [Legionella pneumophila subsp. fraseri]MDX1846921.1 hypothetical protein [Legionella pneumophila subsp. fraseri]HAT1771158.1 hypothetical protein [Legionella pneumophila]HAT1883785.1 hypothetical protein [Legionella pneumophila]HAT2115431.1 hypothetical protein [Legionella pneumophila]